MKSASVRIFALGLSGLAATLSACTPTPTPTPSAAPNPGASASTAPAATAAPATAAHAAPAATETWELPGSLGPLTTRTELEARFGKTNVRDDSLPGAEGEGTVPVLTVFPDDAKQRLQLVLDPEQPNNQDAPIQELRITDPDSRWHDANGLHPGMTLAELVKRNGAPISFYGLDWDYGGSVQDWHDGKLANAVGDKLFHRVTLAARANSTATALPTGDTVFRSDDPRWPAIGNTLVVSELGISWPHEGE